MEKIAICVIVKNTYKYMDEWIEYYLNLGFDKIIIYDNNDISDKRKIKTKHFLKVDIINCRSKYNAQLESYKDCYEKYGDYYDWIAFFDSDEYLQLNRNKWNDVHDLLNNYSNADILAINWVNYGDMGKIKRNENIPVNKFFTEPAKKWNDFYHYKQFIRTCLEDIEIHQHSIISNNPNIKRMDIGFHLLPLDKPLTKRHYQDCFIKHVLTKTLMEYIEEKAFNGKPTTRNDRTNEKSFGYYFDVNEITPEKEKVINDFLKMREEKIKPRFILYPNFAKIKNYSDDIYNIAITSDERYRNFLNRPSRILIMSVKEAQDRFKEKLEIIN